ncbi:Zinc finger in N-recognin family protein [Histomonas meleagridis]|uniref:Zinc finger in N-recognin family protein n=1 Tax=Histomonas meleagridis TaxID=135588 RepID=UPI00355A2DA2|nr:Zinc finger in N-recognin family protein [Histomonas meleagridis]KAH0803849.1 Zinc finger in N-recognin family protein [Histomonas meleagridis]
MEPSLCTLVQKNPIIKQPIYSCKTCGIVDDYGICEVCAKTCHEGHELVLISKDAYGYCDCGTFGECKCRPPISEMKCSNMINPNGSKQLTFFCEECGVICCVSCALKCHKDHVISLYDIVNQKCDCGSGYGLSPCKIMPPPDPPHICTFKRDGLQFTRQHVYRCVTCGMDENNGLCEACAKLCHRGHYCIDCGEKSSFCCDCAFLHNPFQCQFFQGSESSLKLECDKTIKYICNTCNTSICSSCAQLCHNGHEIFEIEGESSNTQCECGKHCKLPMIIPRQIIKPVEGHCTFEQTGKEYAPHERMFQCRTCRIDNGSGVCEECAKVCHKGHDLVEIKNVPDFYCDCGAGDCAYPCKLMKTKENKCSIQENGVKYVKQKMYYCSTCGIVGNLVVCEACARVCHASHDVCLADEGKCALCCCGTSMSHPKAQKRCCGGHCGCEHGHGCDGCEHQCGNECGGCEHARRRTPRCKLASKIEPIECVCAKSQLGFKCTTCGVENICEHCAMLCHMGHSVECVGDISDMECQCGKYCKLPLMLQPHECTCKKNGKHFVAMGEVFRCNTCKMKENEVCCGECTKQCHKGHDLEKVAPQMAVCCCGSGKCPNKCKLMNDE